MMTRTEKKLAARILLGLFAAGNIWACGGGTTQAEIKPYPEGAEGDAILYYLDEAGNIYGAYDETKEVSGGKVTADNNSPLKTDKNVYGGYAGNGTAQNNTVNLILNEVCEEGYIGGDVYGNYSYNNDAAVQGGKLRKYRPLYHRE